MRKITGGGWSCSRECIPLGAQDESAQPSWAASLLGQILVGFILFVYGGSINIAQATTIDLCHLVNDFAAPHCGLPFPWIPTRPNFQYRLDAPQCNPPVSPACPLVEPPTGSVGNFVGVLNLKDKNTSGKLAHRAMAGAWPAGTCFTVALYAKRDHCGGLSSSPHRPTNGAVMMQIRGWTAGAEPMVNPTTDVWSRRELFTCAPQPVFTPGDPDPGEVKRTLSCCPNTSGEDIAYVTWTISGRNPRHTTYVTFDCQAGGIGE